MCHTFEHLVICPAYMCGVFRICFFVQRDNVVRSFRGGQVWVLICTELMGRGIDFKGVSLVINYDFPPSAISYIHRIGKYKYYMKIFIHSFQSCFSPY
jgi:hypothetical protein